MTKLKGYVPSYLLDEVIEIAVAYSSDSVHDLCLAGDDDCDSAICKSFRIQLAAVKEKACPQKRGMDALVEANARANDELRSMLK